MKNIYKNFIADVIIAILALALGIIMLPPFGIGQQVLNVLLAVALIFYLALYLLGKITASSGSVLILTVVEFTIVALIALGLILQQFKVFTITGVCTTFGIVIWLRGVVCLVRGYFVSTSAARRRYSLLLFIGYIFLVSLGAYMFAKPFISDEALVWIFSITFFVIALLFVVFAILYTPKKNTKKSKKKSNQN